VSKRDQLTSIKDTFLNARHPMRAQLARAAQQVYDDWQLDEEGYDWQVGAGGICHLIADAMTDVLSKYSVWSQSQSCSHEVHVNVIAQFREGIYVVDINPYDYETGGGYTWKKRPDIEFTPDFVTADKLDGNPFNLREYVEEYEGDADDAGFGDFGAGTPRKASPSRVERWLDLCLDRAIRPNLIIFTGCRNVTMLTARVVEYLGYEAVVMQGRAREWDTKRRVAHIWVEIPELGIGVETNPSQVLGLPVLALVLPLARFKKHTHQFERPEILCEVTPEGEKFFDQLAQEVATCVRTKR
jgi:hypothetical protein